MLRHLTYPPAPASERPPDGWPLVLFLHGAGERGDDLRLLEKYGPPARLLGRESVPFITVMPQCPARAWWTRYLDDLIALVDETLHALDGDPRRVVATGFSMGGFGACALGAAYPDRLAAIAAVGGSGLTPFRQGRDKICRLKDIPVWVLHGEDDLTVDIASADWFVRQLRACGGSVRFTAYPGTGHVESAFRAFGDPALYDWLLEQQRE